MKHENQSRSRMADGIQWCTCEYRSNKFKTLVFWEIGLILKNLVFKEAWKVGNGQEIKHIYKGAWVYKISTGFSAKKWLL